MRYLSRAAIVVALLTVGTLGAAQLGLFSGSPPANLGVTQNRLLPPALTPNSVSSQAELYPDHPQRQYAHIAPLKYAGDADLAMGKLRTLLLQNEGMVMINDTPDYVYVQASTPLLKFTDDLEFWLDRKNEVIQVRSASRLGGKDFGTNRARVESIRARLVF